jgi:hypothetical protein
MEPEDSFPRLQEPTTDPSLNTVHTHTSCTFTIHFYTVFSSKLCQMVSLYAWKYKLRSLCYEFYCDILNLIMCVIICGQITVTYTVHYLFPALFCEYWKSTRE